MAAVLVPWPFDDVADRTAHPSLTAAARGLDRSSPQLIRLAFGGAVTFSVVFATLVVGGIAVSPPASSHTVQAIGATALYLPIHLNHLRYGLRGERPPAGLVTLAIMAVVIIGAAPIIGSLWLFAFFALGSSALLVARPNSAVPLFGAIVVIAGAAAAMLGEPAGIVAWTMVGVVYRGVTPNVLMWLACAVRDLHSARAALALEAVVAERTRLEARLRDNVGAQLEAVVRSGQHASEQLAVDPGAVAKELDELVVGARRTLTEARRLVATYRSRSARAEVESAADLLRATGVDVVVSIPASASLHSLSDAQRSALRAYVADLLRTGSEDEISIALDDTDAALVVREKGRTVLEHSHDEPAA